jgi:hypothetical protein
MLMADVPIPVTKDKLARETPTDLLSISLI